MPQQDYKCPDHRAFEHTVPFGADVPSWVRCPVRGCGRKSVWVPPTVAVIWRWSK